MAAQRTDAREDPDGFAVAVVRENATWRCSPMSPKALTSLAAAETELRELRSAGAVFGLLDVDDEIGATWWGTRWPSSKTDRAPQAVLALLTAATRASQRDGAGRDTVEDSE
jgi:hypothetical protein